MIAGTFSIQAISEKKTVKISRFLPIWLLIDALPGRGTKGPMYL